MTKETSRGTNPRLVLYAKANCSNVVNFDFVVNLLQNVVQNR